MTLTIQTAGGPREVEATKVGEHMAIHRAGSTFWDLSHIASGRLAGRFVSRRAAREFAAIAEAHFPQLADEVPEFDAGQVEALREMLRESGGARIVLWGRG